MDDDSKKMASSSAAATAIPDVTMEAAAVAMSAAAAEWSPSPSPTAVSSSEEDEDEDDDTLPEDDIAFARAVARDGLEESSFCHLWSCLCEFTFDFCEMFVQRSATSTTMLGVHSRT